MLKHFQDFFVNAKNNVQSQRGYFSIAKNKAIEFRSMNQGCQMLYFQTKKSQFGYIFEGLRLDNVDIFYCYLECFKDIWDIV
jgi:hypothetical protein